MPEKLIFEKGRPGRRAAFLPAREVPARPLEEMLPPQEVRKDPPALPEVSEVELVRHFVRLSRENYGVDVGFYPLGSCSMKYNPKVNEEAAALPGFAGLHPLQPDEETQGALKLMHELERFLCAIGGVDRVSLQPAAGAQGELAGLLIARAYHRDHGNVRRTVLIPDSAHGTNPASAALAGYQVKVVPSNRDGLVDLEALKAAVDDQTAALMLTNPNTLGLFERDIEPIARILHDAGALIYMDGANLNALLGIVRPGDMGFDLVHFNLHKTFSTPHGGGGPGAGPIGVKEPLAQYLPAPVVERDPDGRYRLDPNRPKSIGRLTAFNGNFGILVRAYAYIRRLGPEGIARISRAAILNANYVRARLQEAYPIPYNRPCMHEFVASAKQFRAQEIHAWDIAKRLIDFGIYPPTVNFPLIVEEALMIESPESEPRETLDQFCEAMLRIAREAEEEPAKVREAPHTTPLGRLDEVLAARKPNLRWRPSADTLSPLGERGG